LKVLKISTKKLNESKWRTFVSTDTRLSFIRRIKFTKSVGPFKSFSKGASCCWELGNVSPIIENTGKTMNIKKQFFSYSLGLKMLYGLGRVGKGNLLANAHEIASLSSPQASHRTVRDSLPSS